MNQVPLRDSDDALQVNWCELVTTNAVGKIVYKNAFVTDHLINEKNVVAMVAAGRARWKIESAPQAHKVATKGFVVKCCKAVGKMVVGPPESAIRSRLQTTSSGCY